MDEKIGLMLHNHNDVYTLSYDPSSSTCTDILHVKHPVKSYHYGIEFFGCCNGLVFLRHVDECHSNVLILWNPTTNEGKKVPFPKFEETEQCLESVEYGIGYSSRTLPSEDSEVILRFDIETEKFDEMPLPDLFGENSETSLCVLGGSLCLLGFDPKVGADVWEMKQDGNEKSWTKLFTIDLQKHFGGLVKNLMPLQCLKDGNILIGLDMDTGFQIVLYDPKHDTTTIVKVHEDLKNGCLHISVFGESQVSFNTGTYLGKQRFANSNKRRRQ